MHTGKKIRHLAHKSLLTLLGPAQLDQHIDPIARLEREYEATFGPRPQKPQRSYTKKRTFDRTLQNV
jgi:hypothetical protein